jgi:hypothetical protein
MYLCLCCWLLLPLLLPCAVQRADSNLVWVGFVWCRVMGVGVGVVGFDSCVCARALCVCVDYLFTYLYI